METLWAQGLRRLLADAQWRQVELAHASGVDKNTLTNILRGAHVKTDTLEKLARAFNARFSQLGRAPITLADFFVSALQAEFLRDVNLAKAELLGRADTVQRMTEAVLRQLMPTVAAVVAKELGMPERAPSSSEVVSAPGVPAAAPTFRRRAGNG